MSSDNHERLSFMTLDDWRPPQARLGQGAGAAPTSADRASLTKALCLPPARRFAGAHGDQAWHFLGNRLGSAAYQRQQARPAGKGAWAWVHE